MPIVVSNKQRVFYRFEGESGAYLLLHHGLFGSHEDWYRAGYVEALAREFRLVIPDARGHGRSDKPTAPQDYSAAELTDDLVAIMNSLGIRNMHFLGYGLGALVGMSVLRRFPERVRIVMLGGESPLPLPAVREHWQGMLEALRQGTLAEAAAGLRARDLVLSGGAPPAEDDRAALLALVEAVAGWEPHGEERINPPSPIALFAGAQDPALARVERARSYIQRARLSIFPGLGHAGVFEERQLLTQELLRLLKPSRREEGGEGAAGRPPGEAAPGSAEAQARRDDAPEGRPERRDPGQGDRRRGGEGGRREPRRRRGQRRRSRAGGRWNDASPGRPQAADDDAPAPPDAPDASPQGAEEAPQPADGTGPDGGQN